MARRRHACRLSRAQTCRRRARGARIWTAMSLYTSQQFAMNTVFIRGTPDNLTVNHSYSPAIQLHRESVLVKPVNTPITALAHAEEFRRHQQHLDLTTAASMATTNPQSHNIDLFPLNSPVHRRMLRRFDNTSDFPALTTRVTFSRLFSSAYSIHACGSTVKPRGT
ncbi:hypothetical protein BU23DRAFT_121071 [Bimuria novae-zelandiae CBS 107.79]|uniref:Uncharacterized protein n=1 Tax=Bimuria novae-zelandiae CBS 107.79 TaxID=1447943 RepID=A0A6A5VA43_9PLEO|nr:hypothetical protein BU23DRAFT_121071 [Bimuria novae-zelandiae CBS 107.79]